MEFRKRVRHRLAASAVFTWQGAQQSWLSGEGVTRDISFDGAFIFSLTCPPCGTAIELDVLLLPLHSGERSLRMRSEERRVGKEGGSRSTPSQSKTAAGRAMRSGASWAPLADAIRARSTAAAVAAKQRVPV